MSYSLDRLNALITSQQLFIKSKEIMAEYQAAIDNLMSDTIVDDVEEMSSRINPENIEELGGVEHLAVEETVRRMSKYGQEFFNSEIERLMDAYNDGLYDKIEYNLRCEILTGINDSLQNFNTSNIEE